MFKVIQGQKANLEGNLILYYYIGLSIVSVYVLLLPYFTVNKDFHHQRANCVFTSVRQPYPDVAAVVSVAS